MKLKDYLDSNRIEYKEFAKKIGINYCALIHALKGRRKIPQKFWKAIIEETHGKVSLGDLYGF